MFGRRLDVTLRTLPVWRERQLVMFALHKVVLRREDQRKREREREREGGGGRERDISVKKHKELTEIEHKIFKIITYFLLIYP